ncbi:MAG: hypothetical protein H6574_20585 [Lewinellaceae bacterium]|nr:hypothetical protein [Saprospiraceae bacterium]MCB9317621.1 hypothetical protein [Lewinellaceae bacterium]MCB9333463.1 hypothetical protein [Lewinellaceae bacterium]
MKHATVFPIFTLGLLLLFACTAPRTYSPGFGESARFSGPGGVITESLFNDKDRTISEADIRMILDGKIRIPDSIRLAVFQYGGSASRYGAWNWYDEENLKTQQQLLDTFSQTIGRANRVQQVFFLPAMVTGLRPNMHQLRESAVRVQADMLLVYSLHSDLFRKYRAFKKDEAKAFATCEVVLMDTRTGIIPHTNIVTKSAYSTEERADFSQEELQKRTLYLANLQTLLEAGRQLSTFLNEANNE